MLLKNTILIKERELIMPKVRYDNIIFDSELEVEYYKYLKENNIRFMYQNEYNNNPIKINLGRRKTYTPDFIVFDDENKIIKIIELKGYAKWSANEDNNIMDFMKNKVATDKDFLIEWLAQLDIDTRGWDIDYSRLKHLKAYGFVDFNFKNPNSISNQRKNKIIELDKEIKEFTHLLHTLFHMPSWLPSKSSFNFTTIKL